ncbi:hypothetical protein [Thiobacter aerophilum]|uniref:Peptidase MA-like domain-containing protein n=1 Tax=Thiobacter aerophilum TaxID=3121275 RepID=A0ABV0EBL2_9BURK
MSLRLAAACLAASLLNLGCATQPLRSPVSFAVLEDEPRVRFEPGAEAYARQVAALLPQAVAQVEAAHYLPFADLVMVHVCGSETCFAAHVTSRNVSGATVPDNQVFLAPRLFDRETQRLSMILAHELSHLHLGQRLGHYTHEVPVWFHEGLAALASGGGGADYASEAEARAAFAAGRAFSPATLDTPDHRHRAEDWGLSPHLFYRQAMMFLQYLKQESETRFREFLLRVQDGENFTEAFGRTYNRSLLEAGQRFLEAVVPVAAAPAPPTD